jgi:hypothetical protein
MSSNQSPDTLTRDRIIRIDRSSCIARPELSYILVRGCPSGDLNVTTEFPVNAPPPKGGGFKLRLKAGSVRRSADSLGLMSR